MITHIEGRRLRSKKTPRTMMSHVVYGCDASDGVADTCPLRWLGDCERVGVTALRNGSLSEV